MSQFVLVDGRVFRPREKHFEITEACRKYVAADRAEKLAAKIFSEAGAAARIARENKGWKHTPRPVLEDVQRACVDFGHCGLWLSPGGYNAQDVVGMMASKTGAFQGKGDCAPYFQPFGHPIQSGYQRRSPSSLGGNLPLASTQSFIPAWFGRHFFADENTRTS